MTPKDQSRLGALFIALVLALIVASRVVAIADGRDPGFDQAMLMSNFPLASPADWFRPLPHFEQATTLGSLISLDLISHVFGDTGLARFHATRVLAALVACLGYLALVVAYRRSLSARDTALAVILIASTQEVLLFSTNPKHYIWEFLCSALLILAAQAYLRRPDAQRIALFLGTTVFTCIFAFVAPLMLVTIGGGMLAATLVTAPRPSVLLRLVAMGTAALAISYGFYRFYTTPMAVYDTLAYASEYVNAYVQPLHPVSAHNTPVAKNALNVFYQMVEPAYLNEALFKLGLYPYRLWIQFAAALVALLGFPRLWRQAPLLAGGLVSGVLGTFALNVAGTLPVDSVRQFFFLTPFAVPCFALGLVAIVETLLSAVRARSWSTPLIAVVVAGIGAAALLRSSDLEYKQVSVHLAEIDSHPPAALWVYYGAQPSLRALRPDLLERTDPPVFGLLPDTSTEKSWTRVARDEHNTLTNQSYFDRAMAELSGTEPVWLLFTHTWPEELTDRGVDRFFDFAEADGRVCYRRSSPGGLLGYCAMPDAIPEDIGARYRPDPGRSAS